MTNYVLSIDFNPGRDTLWFLNEEDAADAIEIGVIDNDTINLTSLVRKAGNYADLVPLLPDFLAPEAPVTLFGEAFGAGWTDFLDGIELALQTYDPVATLARGSEIIASIENPAQEAMPALPPAGEETSAGKPAVARETDDADIDWMTGKPRLKPTLAAQPTPASIVSGTQQPGQLPVLQAASTNVTPVSVPNPIPGILTAQGAQVPTSAVSIDWALMMAQGNAYGTSYTHTVVLQPLKSTHQGVPAILIGYCDLPNNDADIEDTFQAMAPGIALTPVPTSVTFDSGSAADEMIDDIQERLSDFFGIELEAIGITFNVSGPVTFTTVSAQTANQVPVQTGAGAPVQSQPTPTMPGAQPTVTQPGQVAAPQPVSPAPPPAKDLTAAIDDLVKLAIDNPAILETLKGTPGLLDAVKAKLPKPTVVEKPKPLFNSWDRSKFG